MIQQSDALQLRYNPGQFTFKRFDPTASTEELYGLAMQINSLQEDDAQVFRVQVFSVL